MRLHSAQRGNPVLATGLSRSRSVCLGIATSMALVLHGGVLLWRPDASGSSHAIGSRVIAVRMLSPQLRDAPAPPSVEAERLPGPGRAQTNVASAGAVDAGQARAPVHAESRRSTRATSVPVASPAPAPAQAAPSNAALAPAPDYLSGARLDPGPRPLGDIQPEYPEAAHLQEGMVVLRLLISEKGVVDDVAVVKADPKGVFDDAAVAAFKAAPFSPGMVLGTPVKSQITVEVEFLPINRGARISGRMY